MRVELPAARRSREDLLQEMEGFRAGDAKYAQGRTWSMVYWPGDGHHEVVRRAHDLFLAENALNPMAFKSLRRMEREVVEMTAGLLHGPPSVVGTMTSGGTESLLNAVKTYRDRARRRWPWILRPKIVASDTVHPAFDKAAHLFGVRLDIVPSRADGSADVAAMSRRIDRNTILLVGSAPQYAHGTVDPIPELGALAESRGLPLHVDACFGGFLLPWLEELGVDLPAWDYRVPGVTSISADVHKYGYAAKGASVITYRDLDVLKYQFFVATRWSGGIYASPGMPGSRPGGPIAAAWASMQALGREGYLELAQGVHSVAQALRAGLEAIPELQVLGRPHSSIVTYAAKDHALDVFVVADLLEAKGWFVDRQQNPPSIHCSANAANGPVLEEYLADVREAVAEALAHPELSQSGQAAMYGLMGKVPVEGLVAREVRKLLEDLHAPGGGDLDPESAEPPPAWAVRGLDALDRVRRRLGRAR